MREAERDDLRSRLEPIIQDLITISEWLDKDRSQLELLLQDVMRK